MARGAGDRRWLAVSMPELRTQLSALVDAEASAVAITDVAPLLIPGLLQSSSYTREIMVAASVPADEVNTRVALRMGRKDVIMRRDEPVRYLALIGEAALRNVLGVPALMVDQLRLVLELSNRPNIDVRVVPLRSGWNPALEGPFLLIESEGEQCIVHLENRRSALVFHEEEDVEAYRQAVGYVAAVAMAREETREFISGVIEELGRMA
ncbi:hypothetical protein SAMN05444320_1011041 [Streptoalloteichus hindustanus]|uniref:DUF5753 domain-containing protein n=2 Tax=Streptoalloteichus hindustanus TaxID=2017 RepID=A0A1M4W874_STRHI|nr:hypothetical protein SAMN05444320_1011041 [Streptoalloteichus hindustanus]